MGKRPGPARPFSVVRALAAVLALAGAAAAAEPASGARPDAWWRVFGDPALDAVIARVDAANPTIARYAARLDGARAAARAQRAETSPTLSLEGGASDAGGPLINAVGGSGSLFSARAMVSWQADLFGKTSGLREASRDEVIAAAAQRDGVRLLVESEAVLARFEALAADAGLDLAQRRLALASEDAATAARARDLGLRAASDMRAPRDAVAAARIAVDSARLRRQQALDRLAALMGEREPPPLTGTLASDAPPVPAGLAGDLLTRRPDIGAARARLQASDARLRATRRAWLPDITLTASGGAASSTLLGLLEAASRGYGMGLLLATPLFDGGRHSARVAGARAATDEARAAYDEQVLAAFRETADCLATLAAARARQAELAARLADERAALAAMRRGIATGLRSRSAGLAAEGAVLEREEDALHARAETLAAAVRLVRALGGGWSPTPG
ncbi:MAG: efflux transporter outer membrane subunit [Sphingomonadales bacterium]|nr:efflux transporter outer membrane subunit [Sphingomonadales bacterium]